MPSLQFGRIETGRDRPLSTGDPDFASTPVVAIVADLIGHRKRVLDVGCGTGVLSRILAAHECDIVGIDRDPLAVEEARRFCAHAFVADIDSAPIAEIVGARTFDAIVVADVLGQLREPLRVLDECRALLDEGGALVASVRNGAHGSIRLALFSGTFSDPFEQTRSRLFNAKSLEELFVHAGFRIERMERIIAPLAYGNASVDAIAEVEADPESETLSFVVRATPLSNEAKYRAISKRFLLVSNELVQTHQALSQRERELERVRTERTSEGDARQRQLIDGLRRALDEAIVQHDAVASKTANLERRLAEMTANRDEHVALGENALRQYREVRDALAAVTAQCDALVAARDALIVEHDAALADRGAAEAFERQLASGRATIAALEARASSYIDSIAEFQDRDAVSCGTIEALEARAASYADSIAELQDRDASNRAAIEGLEQLHSSLSERDARLGEMQRINAGLEREVFDTWDRLERIGEERDTLLGALAELGERLEDEHERYQLLSRDLRAHVARADEREAAVGEDLEILRKLADERVVEMGRLSDELARSERKANSIREEYDVMQTRLVLQMDAFSDASEAESRRLATLIDAVQSGPYWTLKRFSDRVLGFFSR